MSKPADKPLVESLQSPTVKRIDVAVAVVFNEHGQVLWGSRPEGKPYAGYWEFPGGKLEQGETVWQALVRELHEELGIVAKEGGPWFLIEHDYEHAKVRLHLYRVWSFEGEPQCLEGQTVKWGHLNTSEVAPILPATAPLLPVLAQPELMLVTDFVGVGEQVMLRRLEKALQLAGPTGLRVLFREKSANAAAQLGYFTCCAEWCSARGVDLIINSESAQQLQTMSSCSGWKLHLTQAHLQNLPESLACCAVLGASVHDQKGLDLAFAAGLQYAVLGAVQVTSSHPGQPPLGWPGFQQLAASARLPVFAIGGLKPDQMLQAKSHGAHGMAMITGFDS